MKRHITLALLALNLACCLAAPQNQVEVAEADSSSVGVAGEKSKGDMGLLDSMQNDQIIRMCANMECKLVKVADAKALAPSSISGLFRLKGNAAMTKALTPSLTTVMESMKGLNEQNSRLQKLQAEMAALNSMFSQGAQAAARTKGLFAATVTKGIRMPAAPRPKAYAAALAPSKGMFAAMPSMKAAFAAPPSKGGSAAATMQLEAAMCPMTMYELGKSQKLYAETNSQLQRSNAMSAMLMSEKSRLETQKAIVEMGKAKAEQQAAFNAKYAAEQKSRADMLAIELAKANAEKAALRQEKALLEGTLKATREALAREKSTTAALTGALKTCNEDKAQLQHEKEALINELKETQESLRKTRQELAQEKADHDKTRRQLAATQKELEATEEARKQLEVAKQQLEDELAETKSQLDTVTNERNQLQQSLDRVSAQLAKCNIEKMKCGVALSQEKTLTAQLNKQINDAMVLLAAEKKAREEITALLMSVKNTAENLQKEVQKLQLENVQLRQQLDKLRSEQETALAMAAGCPPTYEKFGKSCYKYVREKTQWKMAQEQCMKDGGNLVSIESKREQVFLVNYLKRHGAASDTYVYTGGHKKMNHWKWLGSNQRYIGERGPEYWFNLLTKTKPGYDCQAMYLRDRTQFGKWVGLPCYSAAPYTCEHLLAPHQTAVAPNAREAIAMGEMYKEAPAYLANAVSSKGALRFAPPAAASRGVISLAMASKGRYY